LDVFDEDEAGPALGDDAAGVAPEVALVVFPVSVAGEAVRLTRDAAKEEIHDATPGPASEGGNI
jgi:hypothetical protein